MKGLVIQPFKSRNKKMSDNIYQEFGASENAIVSSGELSEHEKAMLEMDGAVRDGDDSIETTVQDEEYDEPEDEQEFEESDEDDSDEDETTEEVAIDKDESKNLDNASQELKDGAEGLQNMVEMAVKNGLPQESIQTIMSEYMDNQELSNESMKLLEEHGFTRKFVNNYIAGQNAIVERMAQSLVNFVGGPENWESITGYLQKNDTDTLDSLQEALDNNNIKQVKTILTLTKKTIDASKSSKFGAKQQRSITKSAKPQIQVNTNTVKGYANQQEMVKAMSDKRYANDAAYRSEVEQRVMRSNF